MKHHWKETSESKNPDWMYKGQKVYIRATLIYPDEKPTTGVLVEVIAAHGDHARVRHEKSGFEQLMPKWNLWIKNEKLRNQD